LFHHLRTPKSVELTSDALEKLLSRLSADPDEAASKYEVVRSKLIHFFEWRKSDLADALADETLDRVARRIDEGVQIDNLIAYLFAVARRVWQEKRSKQMVPLDDVMRDNLRRQVETEAEEEPRLECLDRCLSTLPRDNRQLIIDYYQEERRLKIQLRQQLAEKLGIPLNALRIRAHRIRATLESCITKCVETMSEAK
jgi:DNA-directed RNA polymerase specialized sigma24 family protein